VVSREGEGLRERVYGIGTRTSGGKFNGGKMDQKCGSGKFNGKSVEGKFNGRIWIRTKASDTTVT
jgi:hypothetical protein